MWYNKGMENKNKLLLIDGSSVAFRAFFALYNQIDRFKNHSGLHTNAIYGFHLMLDHMMKRVQPTHVLVAFDAGKTTFGQSFLLITRQDVPRPLMNFGSSFLIFVICWERLVLPFMS